MTGLGRGIWAAKTARARSGRAGEIAAFISGELGAEDGQDGVEDAFGFLVAGVAAGCADLLEKRR
ncbi:hypothetical protein GCM10010430_81620 [Kitasatospora cystarginea]|uniref:Uncharacterized protein n=1 Tax=Kitasatospora cystarginea TaxID=58350 RepID=A0ABN3F3R5_9ACTN